MAEEGEGLLLMGMAEGMVGEGLEAEAGTSSISTSPIFLLYREVFEKEKKFYSAKALA